MLISRLKNCARPPAGPGNRSRRTLLGLLRAALALGAIAWLAGRSDWNETAAGLSALPSWAAPALIGAYLAAQMVSGLKWAIMARAAGFGLSMHFFVLIYLEGMFAGLFLPGLAGADAWRTAVLGRRKSLGRAAGTVLADRATGLIVLICLAGAAALLPPVRGRAPALGPALLAAAFLLALLALLLTRAAGRWREAQEGMAPLQEAGVAAQVLGISLLFHMLLGAAHAVLGWNLGLAIPLPYYFLAYAASSAAGAAALTAGGTGERFAGLLFTLQWAGAQEAQASSFALAWTAVTAVAGLLSGAAFFIRRPDRLELPA